MATKKTTGGARNGPGRKADPDSCGAMITARVRADQKQFWDEHLGAEWLRKQINKAIKAGAK